MRKFVNDIILTNNKESWRQQGICSQTDPDIWFPGAGQSAQARLAIELCSQCPVRIECLEPHSQQKMKNAVFGVEPP